MKRKFDYGTGVLITFIISIGCAAIAYGGQLLSFDFLNLPAWVFGPLGVYTLIFAFMSKETLYYLAWSIIFLAIAVISALYMLVNVIVVFGFLLIAIAVIASFAYFKNRKPS